MLTNGNFTLHSKAMNSFDCSRNMRIYGQEENREGLQDFISSRRQRQFMLYYSYLMRL